MTLNILKSINLNYFLKYMSPRLVWILIKLFNSYIYLEKYLVF
jgi:hypothetical protein